MCGDRRGGEKANQTPTRRDTSTRSLKIFPEKSNKKSAHVVKYFVKMIELIAFYNEGSTTSQSVHEVPRDQSQKYSYFPEGQ